MPYLQTVMLMGHVGRDAELRQKDDYVFAKFSLAVTRYPQNNTTWYNCVIWTKSATKAAELIKKGDTVFVIGEQNIGEKGVSVTVTDWKLVKKNSKAADAKSIDHDEVIDQVEKAINDLQLPF